MTRAFRSAAGNLIVRGLHWLLRPVLEYDRAINRSMAGRHASEVFTVEVSPRGVVGRPPNLKEVA